MNSLFENLQMMKEMEIPRKTKYGEVIKYYLPCNHCDKWTDMIPRSNSDAADATFLCLDCKGETTFISDELKDFGVFETIEELNDIAKTEAIDVQFPWRMVATYENHPEEIMFQGNDEEDCMYKIAKAEEQYGKCTWYSGYSDEDYEAGEYIGAENFIY